MRTWPGGGRRRKVLAIASVASVVAVVGGVATAITLTGKSHSHDKATTSASPPRVASVTSSFKAAANVTPPVAASRCTTPTAFTYSGTISAAAPATVTYQWTYSSGQPGPVQTVRFVSAGSEVVTGETVKSKAAGVGWGEIKMISPVAQTSNKATYTLLCGAGSAGGIIATATVTPAAMTAGCATAPPDFTATGSIEVPKAEKVTYYWAQSDGADSAPATLTFTTPGTQSAEPLTITPADASGSGTAVLVVTSPVATASSPATYTLTCKAPATQPGTNQTAPPVNPPLVHSTVQPPPPVLPPLTLINPLGGNATLQKVGTIGAGFNIGVEVEGGGGGPYHWSVTGLPAGLTFTTQVSGSSFSVVGTPTTAGTFPVTATVRDNEKTPKTATVTGTIDIQPITWVISTNSLPDGTVGHPYTATIAVTNGVTVSWSASGLPAGLSLNSVTGTISGTPTTAGPAEVSVTATVTQAGAGTTTQTRPYSFSIQSAAA